MSFAPAPGVRALLCDGKRGLPRALYVNGSQFTFAKNDQEWFEVLASGSILNATCCQDAPSFTFLDTLRPERGNNKTGWANMEFDALIEKANNTNDREMRYSILMEAERILIDEMPIIPIYTYVSAYQLSPDVKGYYPNYLNHHHPKTLYLERD